MLRNKGGTERRGIVLEEYCFLYSAANRSRGELRGFVARLRFISQARTFWPLPPLQCGLKSRTAPALGASRRLALSRARALRYV
jgi:hypothetical protein